MRTWLEIKVEAGRFVLFLSACWAKKPIFFCSWIEIYNIPSSGSQAYGVGFELHHRLCWFPACRQQSVELLSLHKHVNKFSIINLLLYYEWMNEYCWFCFSGKPWLNKAVIFKSFSGHPHIILTNVSGQISLCLPIMRIHVTVIRTLPTNPR